MHQFVESPTQTKADWVPFQTRVWWGLSVVDSEGLSVSLRRVLHVVVAASSVLDFQLHLRCTVVM